MNFFDKFDEKEKFNLFLGDFFLEKINNPTRIELAKLLTKDMKSNLIGYIKDENSLFQVTQVYLDGVISSRKMLLKKIKSIYETATEQIDMLEVLSCSNKINAIFSTDYNRILENINLKKVTKILPGDDIDSNLLIDKIKFYKILGDIENYEKIFISTQDFKKLKILDFYKNFFKMIKEDIVKFPTILLGLDLNNSDFIDILEFILMDVEKKQTIYAVTDSTVLQTKTIERFNNMGIKLLPYSVKEFYEDFKRYLEIETMSKDEEEKEFIVKKLFR